MNIAVPLVRTAEHSFTTVPNMITLTRTVGAVALAVAAIVAHSWPLLIGAYAVYWIGDTLDGIVARWLDQETRAGAVFDIISDRACTSLCLAALLMLKPAMVVPLAIFLVQFMILDTMLSLSFLMWPLVSPNYFARVDPRVYRWNWSAPAKVLNTSAVVLLVLISPSPLYPALLAAAVTLVKIASMVRVARLAASLR
ncbi:CDP-diacylglycerol--glycerol-3-phosphate 3-phosphatidyltransferase [Catenuloplanes nepalensis]|uniref:CDP-diacylglycerol--glycerol-3-phosphate 3-phosphatidyltransferase n=1 Tax=Catenuloplanes nepalensis TaxID=587533 RepID=A0ABT9MN42_9ACTN|nr:CDP-alcohol phosphatidyltransferase family protein [Catenuloplanes nepalensis]MDP9792751.1 CDP-diacylglycerol--glycerol-3-phosphate 3-phosphatidyltransferase [Catenuloplanes nepalensis]